MPQRHHPAIGFDDKGADEVGEPDRLAIRRGFAPPPPLLAEHLAIGRVEPDLDIAADALAQPHNGKMGGLDGDLAGTQTAQRHDRAPGFLERPDLQQSGALFDRKPRHPGQLVQIGVGQGEDKPEPNSGRPQCRQPPDHCGKRAALAADAVVRRRHAVEADRDRVENPLQPVEPTSRQRDQIGGERGREPARLGQRQGVAQPGPHQRLAARDAERVVGLRGGVDDEGLDQRLRQHFGPLRPGRGIAMSAGEVAAQRRVQLDDPGEPRSRARHRVSASICRVGHLPRSSARPRSAARRR